jgi:hypothetical protein
MASVVSVVPSTWNGAQSATPFATQPRHCRVAPAFLAPRTPAQHVARSPAKYLGQVFAKDEAEAMKEAAKEFKVAEALRDRIVARKEDY